jgi:hypothetical protein
VQSIFPTDDPPNIKVMTHPTIFRTSGTDKTNCS